jgi:hypothetical protein
VCPWWGLAGFLGELGNGGVVALHLLHVLGGRHENSRRHGRHA